MSLMIRPKFSRKGSSMHSNADRRSLPRYQLDARIEVINQTSGTTLGTLVDIHLEGLLLMGAEQLQSDHLYQIKLMLGGSDSNLEPIEFGIDCLWARAMAQEGRFWAGCRIIDVSPAAQKNLEQLISVFGKSVPEAPSVSV